MKIEFTGEIVLQALANATIKLANKRQVWCTASEVLDEAIPLCVSEDELIDFDNVSLPILRSLTTKVTGHLNNLTKKGLVFKRKSLAGRNMIYRMADPRDIVTKRLS